MNLSERRRRTEENVISAFDLVRQRLAEPSGGFRRFGGAAAVAVGVPPAFYNPVLAFDPATSRDDVLAAVQWIRDKGLRTSVQVRHDLEDELGPAIEAAGLVRDPWSSPVMVLEPIPRAPAPPAGIDIRTGGEELVDDFQAALELPEVLTRVFGHALFADPSVLVAVAYLDGSPVAAAMAIRSGSTVGIYAVGTQERARRRGIGRAVTWAAIEAGAQAWQGTMAALEASEMGLPVYASMGFEEIARFTAFMPPPPPST